MVQRLQLRRP